MWFMLDLSLGELFMYALCWFAARFIVSFTAKLVAMYVYDRFGSRRTRRRR